MKKGRRILLTAGFLTGFLILMYPTFSDAWNRYRNRLLSTEYEVKVSGIDPDERERIREEARQYNNQHTVNEIQDVFNDSEEYILTHPYDSLLDPNHDSVMGAIEIPKIKVELAIYHGTGSDVLSKGAGHIQGTSLPVGGQSTHAVLAAHRGLANAKLFTDLDRMESGDHFFLHILGETLTYEVDQIEVVEPDDLTYIRIEPGRDLVTLLTCTPYGANTHRLLVRGHRINAAAEEKAVFAEDSRYTVSMQRDEPVRFAAAGMAVVFCFITLIRLVKDRKKSKKSKKGRSPDEEDT